jgi:putative ABC transport system permease protein
MALGARRQALLRLVLRQGLALALVGVALGLLGSRSLTRLLVGSLYGVRPGDPASLLLAVGLLLGTALLAILAPAVRATRVDPVDALRRE